MTFAGLLVARSVTGAVPLRDVRGPVRVIVPSLARGGAERIVVEWLAAEARRGRAIELALLHRRIHEYSPPPHVTVLRRGLEPLEQFVDNLGHRWGGTGAPPVATHLVADVLLARLWAAGVRTVPVVHNTREGWRNSPAAWPVTGVPMAIACAETVRGQVAAGGCRVPVIAVRHRPQVGAMATDWMHRETLRARLGIAADAFVIGAVGAMKPQKDYVRAVEILARIRHERDAVLVLVGGVPDDAGLAELDRVAEAAARLGVAASLRLPGFADPVDPWYAAFDVLLNVSRHEGLSMATAEALAAGLPVVATDVGGQRELVHRALTLLPAAAPAEVFSAVLARLPVRASLQADPAPRYPRAWSVALGHRAQTGERLDVLFVTANLSAGGAQRSLVNLATTLVSRRRIAVAVCGESTHREFPERMALAGIECFRPAPSADPFDVAEAIVAQATARGARTVCFWNADARVKLLAARFLPPRTRLVDACPGAYAFAELEAASALGEALAFGPCDYYARLDVLVTKFHDAAAPACRCVAVVPNGVALLPVARRASGQPRFLVSGRIAPSKRLETILEAFRQLVRDLPGASLLVAGQAEPRHAGYLQEILDLARGLPVDFLGAQPGLACLEGPCTAAVVLGTNQGCPNAVLEAMAAGIAVIANASGGTPELVHDGATGWLLPESCTAGELAHAMAQTAADAGRVARYGEAARAHVASHYSLEAMAVRYLSLFDTPEQPQMHSVQDPAPHAFPRLRTA